MKILAFDASTAMGSIAVWQDGTILGHLQFENPRGRGGAFFAALATMVQTHRPFDRIAVGVGPGSYNGLRSAVAAARGLQISTGAETVAVESILAFSVETESYLAIGDARGGSAFLARVRNRQLVGEIQLVPIDDLATQIGQDDEVCASSGMEALPGATITFPDARIIAELGANRSPGEVNPLYLKPAHITPASRVMRM